MKWLLHFAFVLMASLAWSQASFVEFPVQTPLGYAIAGASAALCSAHPSTVTPCGSSSLQATFSDITLGTACTLNPLVQGPSYGVGCTNPGLSDGYGVVRFYAATGFRWYQLYGSGIVVTDVEPVLFPGTGGGSLTLQTNGVINGSQALLNLQQGSHITLTDNGLGQVTVADTLTPLTLQTNGVVNGSQILLNLNQGSGITLTDNGTGQVTVAATGSGGTVTGTGTTNTLPLWTNGPSGILGNSNLSQSGTAMNLSSQSLVFTGTIGRILCAACNSSPDMFWSTGSNTSPANTDTHIRMEKDAGSGGQIIFVAGTAASLAQAVLNSNGTAGWWQYPQATFANLPSAPNGSRLYCTNCKEVTDPCSTGGGTGAGDFADRINGRWKCN